MKCNADASKEGLIGDAGQIKLKKEQQSVFYKAQHGGTFFFFNVVTKIYGNNTENRTSEEP